MGNLFGYSKIIEILKNIKVLCTLITTIIIAHFVFSALDAPEINNVAKTHIAFARWW